MAEIDFERRLERLFADASELPDASAFAQRIERRLDRGWTARRWLLGAAGLAGGVIGASQLVMSNVFSQVESAEQSARVLSQGIARVTPTTDMVSALSGGYGLWIAVGVAVLTMGFVLARVIEEI
jgi:beta-lactamase regulating signal transducer with metallopeptidase domain